MCICDETAAVPVGHLYQCKLMGAHVLFNEALIRQVARTAKKLKLPEEVPEVYLPVAWYGSVKSYVPKVEDYGPDILKGILVEEETKWWKGKATAYELACTHVPQGGQVCDFDANATPAVRLHLELPWRVPLLEYLKDKVKGSDDVLDPSKLVVFSAQ